MEENTIKGSENKEGQIQKGPQRLGQILRTFLKSIRSKRAGDDATSTAKRNSRDVRSAMFSEGYSFDASLPKLEQMIALERIRRRARLKKLLKDRMENGSLQPITLFTSQEEIDTIIEEIKAEKIPGLEAKEIPKTTEEKNHMNDISNTSNAVRPVTLSLLF